VVEVTDGEPTERAQRWAATMAGHRSQLAGVRHAHDGPLASLGPLTVFDREAREEAERQLLAPGATRSQGAGRRLRGEEPDEWRTCFEKDRDRILHSSAFRRLAGKTQVFIFPTDHQRTRLTHALEVAQIARAIATALRLNVALAEAIALGHDGGHGPFGHASEDAFDPLVPGGFDHEVSDGIRNHSWSRPAPRTPEGEVCAIADRLGYATHDAEDAARAGIVDLGDLPQIVVDRAGTTRSQQLQAFIRDVVVTSQRGGTVGMSEGLAEALASLRAWNYERIYLRPESVTQGKSVVRLLRSLVEHYVAHPAELPRDGGAHVDDSPEHAAVSYVAGMTDRFACAQAARVLRWSPSEMPEGFDRPS